VLTRKAKKKGRQRGRGTYEKIALFGGGERDSGCADANRNKEDRLLGSRAMKLGLCCNYAGHRGLKGKAKENQDNRVARQDTGSDRRRKEADEGIVLGKQSQVVKGNRSMPEGRLSLVGQPLKGGPGRELCCEKDSGASRHQTIITPVKTQCAQTRKESKVERAFCFVQDETLSFLGKET